MSDVCFESWEQLRAALVKITSKRGVRASLARKFGISESAVSHWFSGKNIPSSDTVLALQKWVNEAWAKQENKNAPGSVTSTARSRTRSTRKPYEQTRRTEPRPK